MNEFVERIGAQQFNFKLTPITYTSKDSGLQVVRNNTIQTKIFHDDATGFKTIFLNGKVLPSSQYYVSLVEDLKKSLSSNDFRIGIRQSARRLIVVRNTHGVHARDIFELPFLDSGITRSMLRSVDRAGIIARYS